MKRRPVDHAQKAAECRALAREYGGVLRRLCLRMAKVYEQLAARSSPKAPSLRPEPAGNTEE